jgi:hypothetical protein
MAGETEILMRDMTICLNTGTVAVPVLVPVEGIDKLTWTPQSTTADRRHFTDGGVEPVMKMAIGNTIKFEGKRQEVPTTGVLAAGQDAIEDAANLLWISAEKLWQLITPGGLMLTFNGWCELTGFSGGNDDVMPWGFQITLTSTPAVTALGTYEFPAGNGETECLIRDCVISIDSAGLKAIEGINNISHSPSTTATDTRHFSDGGVMRTLPTARKNEWEFKGLRQANPATGAQIVGQAAVETLAGLVGTASEGSFKFKSAGATAWTFKGIAELTGWDGGNDDAAPWGFKLTATTILTAV